MLKCLSAELPRVFYPSEFETVRNAVEKCIGTTPTTLDDFAKLCDWPRTFGKDGATRRDVALGFPCHHVCPDRTSWGVTLPGVPEHECKSLPSASPRYRPHHGQLREPAQ